MKILPEQKTEARSQKPKGHPHLANPSPAQSSPKRTSLDGSRPSIGHRSGSLPLHLSKIKPTTTRRRQTRSSRSVSETRSQNPEARMTLASGLRRLSSGARSAPGGGERNRTDDLLLAKQALSQLSYTPKALGEAQSPKRRQRRPCAAKAARRNAAKTHGGPGRI